MTNQELLNQLLAVTARAIQAGRPAESVIGSLEIAKHVLIGQTVTVTKEPKPSILAYNGPLPPTHG